MMLLRTRGTAIFPRAAMISTFFGLFSAARIRCTNIAKASRSDCPSQTSTRSFGLVP